MGHPGKLSLIFTAAFTGLHLLFFIIYEVSNSVYLTKREALDPSKVGDKFLGFMPGVLYDWQVFGPMAIGFTTLIGNWIAKFLTHRTFIFCWGFWNIMSAGLMLLFAVPYFIFYSKYVCPTDDGSPCADGMIHSWRAAVIGLYGCAIAHGLMFFDILVLYCTVNDAKSERDESIPLIRRDNRYYEMEDYHPGWAGHGSYQQPAYRTPRRSYRRLPNVMYDDDMDEADDMEVQERGASRMGQKRGTSKVYDTGLSGNMADVGQSKIRTPIKKTLPTTRSNRNTPSRGPATTVVKQNTPSTIHRPVDGGMSGKFIDKPTTVPSRSVSVASRAPSAIRGGAGAVDEPRGRDRRVKEALGSYDDKDDEVDDLMSRYAGNDYSNVSHYM